jgi:hypothetical protein
VKITDNVFAAVFEIIPCGNSILTTILDRQKQIAFTKRSTPCSLYDKSTTKYQGVFSLKVDSHLNELAPLPQPRGQP